MPDYCVDGSENCANCTNQSKKKLTKMVNSEVVKVKQVVRPPDTS